MHYLEFSHERDPPQLSGHQIFENKHVEFLFCNPVNR